MKKILLSALLLAVAAVATTSAQRTTRKGLRAETKPAAAAQSSVADTIISPQPQTVDINGYDKPLRSRRETFFATNNSTDTVSALAFTISYFDTKNRMLHSAEHNIPVEIPPRETRQVSMPSWDSQFAFYFTRSAKPQRVEQATPYDITITVDTLFVRKRNQIL